MKGEMEVNRRVICNNLIFFPSQGTPVHMPTFFVSPEAMCSKSNSNAIITAKLFLASKQ